MNNLAKDSKVNYVAASETKGGKPTIKKGTIVEIINAGAARIALGDDDNHTVGAHYSDKGEVGTFHFPHETSAVKAAETFGEPVETEPAAAAPSKPPKR